MLIFVRISKIGIGYVWGNIVIETTENSNISEEITWQSLFVFIDFARHFTALDQQCHCFLSFRWNSQDVLGSLSGSYGPSVLFIYSCEGGLAKRRQMGGFLHVQEKPVVPKPRCSMVLEY